MVTENTENDGTTPRKRSRSRTLVAGTLWLNGVAREIRIRNVSAGGMMFDCAQALPLEARVSIRSTKTGVVEGQVVWVNGNQYGVSFDSEIVVDLAPPERPTAAAAEPPPVYKRPGFRIPANTEAAKSDDWWE